MYIYFNNIMQANFYMHLKYPYYFYFYYYYYSEQMDIKMQYVLFRFTSFRPKNSAVL